MTMKHFAAALLASTLLASPAFAQSNPAPARAPEAAPAQKPMAESPAAIQSTQKSDQWRASKFVGLNVYNPQNEKIGDIKELIMGQDGQIDLLVIGVGGFLGMGEHNVGLKWNQVKFVNEPVKSASTAPAPATTSRTDASGAPPRATTGTAATTRATAADNVRDYPDHAVVNMNKDQLKGLPAFKYASETKSR